MWFKRCAVSDCTCNNLLWLLLHGCQTIAMTAVHAYNMVFFLFYVKRFWRGRGLKNEYLAYRRGVMQLSTQFKPHCVASMYFQWYTVVQWCYRMISIYEYFCSVFAVLVLFLCWFLTLYQFRLWKADSKFNYLSILSSTFIFVFRISYECNCLFQCHFCLISIVISSV